MKKLTYVLFFAVVFAAFSCTEQNIRPKGDDDPIGIPPPPPPPNPPGNGG